MEPAARSGSVRMLSRWSIAPDNVLILHVPQKPWRHEYGTDGTSLRSALSKVSSAATSISCPVDSIVTVNGRPFSTGGGLKRS